MRDTLKPLTEKKEISKQFYRISIHLLLHWYSVYSSKLLGVVVLNVSVRIPLMLLRSEKTWSGLLLSLGIRIWGYSYVHNVRAAFWHPHLLLMLKTKKDDEQFFTKTLKLWINLRVCFFRCFKKDKPERFHSVRQSENIISSQHSTWIFDIGKKLPHAFQKPMPLKPLFICSGKFLFLKFCYLPGLCSESLIFLETFMTQKLKSL